MCFSCGRIGHSKENCPYTIRVEPSPTVLETKEDGISDGQPCDEHVSDKVGLEVEPSKIMHENVCEEVQSGTYGSWTVVSRRKNGTKFQGNGGSHNGMSNDRLKQELRKNVTEARFSNVTGKFKFNDGPSRESKRKLADQKPTNEAHMANVGLNVGRSDNAQAQASLVKSPKNHEVGNNKEWTEAEVFSSKLDHRALVKGKKAIA